MGTDASTAPGQTPAPAGDATTPPTPTPTPSGQGFTQADVDRIVTDRVNRERAKFADYDDLKAKAGASQTLETRMADLEAKGTAAEQRALRAEIAAEFGISTKKGANNAPSEAELFLTGADENTLRAQAQALSQMSVDRRKQGNVAPKEGGARKSGNAEDESMRDYARALFGRTD